MHGIIPAYSLTDHFAALSRGLRNVKVNEICDRDRRLEPADPWMTKNALIQPTYSTVSAAWPFLLRMQPDERSSDRFPALARRPSGTSSGSRVSRTQQSLAPSARR